MTKTMMLLLMMKKMMMNGDSYLQGHYHLVHTSERLIDLRVWREVFEEAEVRELLKIVDGARGREE